MPSGAYGAGQECQQVAAGVVRWRCVRLPGVCRGAGLVSGTHFSYSVCYTNLLQRQPGYVHANMADLGRMAMKLDVIPEYNAVLASQGAKTAPSGPIDDLNAKIAAEHSDIEGRLQTLTSLLTDAAGQIRAITPAR